jgi:hypothetical protein
MAFRPSFFDWVNKMEVKMCKRALIMTVALATLSLGTLSSNLAHAGASAAGVSSKYTADILAAQRQTQNQVRTQPAKSQLTSFSSSLAKSYARR